MKQISNLSEIKSYSQCELKKNGIGFVPTMGALHDGHISLIKKAKEENDTVIVSIFLNPTQFAPNEDLSSYPKPLEEDLNKCKELEVDIVFTPNIKDMYGENEPKILADKIQSYILDGKDRPSHFDGVLTVVLKLFNLINPTNAYFGKKDAQQLILIKNMVKALFLDINIIPCDLIREKDGLAMSSRNIYLDEKERKKALLIYKALNYAKILIIENNERNLKIIIDEMQKILEPLNIEYINITDRELKYIKKIDIENTIIFVAVKIGDTRLIDNIWI